MLNINNMPETFASEQEAAEAWNKRAEQPERLTDDDFETIRIHLNACKEKLCNQCRWSEAVEYQRIIDRFMAFASAQSEQQHGRIFQEIVVKYPSISTYPEYKGNPYFSIKYTENGQEFIGYGTYKPEVLSEYLKEYFVSSIQPEIIRCKDCEYGEQDEIGRWFCRSLGCQVGNQDGSGYCADAERREEDGYF